MIEEVRLTGEHRYDAVNNAKPYITDARVPIRRMGVDQYSIVNRTSYIMTSNFKDGLPASEGDRYFPIYSKWQDRDQFVEWKEANPAYFADLWDALSEGPSLRRWLLERKLSPEFNAKGRAPDSSNRDEMRALVVDDESDALRRVLDDGAEADFSRVLLDRSRIAEEMLGCGVPVPQGRQMARLMSQQGMTYLGETGFGGRTRGWWSNKPELFTLVDDKGKTRINGVAVQKWLDNYL